MKISVIDRKGIPFSSVGCALLEHYLNCVRPKLFAIWYKRNLDCARLGLCAKTLRIFLSLTINYPWLAIRQALLVTKARRNLQGLLLVRRAR